ncbi:MAG: hypothetical protein ACFFAT_05400 [Promethearchaeota archaeon]
MSSIDIKTIIFDLGGVYFTRGTVLAIEKIKDIYDIKKVELLHNIFKETPNSESYLLRRG